MLPPDCNIETVPADLMLCIDHAIRILGWQENLAEDEMPEHWKWHLDWEIEEHFKQVKIQREAKYGTSSTDSDETYEDEDLFERNLYSPRDKYKS